MGVGDDYDREAMVRAATHEELSALVKAVDALPDDDLYGWLAGPESFSAQPTVEYIALTCLTLAVDSARLRLNTS